MNMAAWGLDKLVEPALLLKDPEFLHQDLQATKVTGCPLENCPLENSVSHSTPSGGHQQLQNGHQPGLCWASAFLATAV